MIEQVIHQRRRSLGPGGFEVGRVLPFAKRRMIRPFIFYDHMGPVDLPAGIPEDLDVLPHPHIGLSTLTYLFDGEMTHRDSLGFEQPIRPGEVNWMTAGKGITHSKRFERVRREGGLVHGIQAWVAMPEADEENDPSFDHYGLDDLPTFDEAGVTGRLVAGEALGLKAAVRIHSPLFYLHWELAAGARTELPADYPERAVYVVSGSIEVDGQRFDAGRMLLLSPGQAVAFTALTQSIVMAIGGEPIGPRFIDWNFVSSSKERIEQAKADWRADYIATKYAVAAYTRGWSRDLGQRDITVNIVQPGAIDTEMNPETSDHADMLRGLTALGRYGKPEDIAAAVAFLVGPDASYITGATLNVDGGQVA